MSALPAKHLFNTQEWRHFTETDFFPPECRAELIEGEVFDMPPIGPDHRSCVDFLTNYLARKLSEAFWLCIQNPVTLGDLSEPEPDVVVARYRDDHYRQSHPGPDEVLLLIEVADKTLTYDRHTKCPLYARFVIPEYWIVNVAEQCVEVYRRPQNGKYDETTIMRDADLLRPLNLGGLEIAANQIFG